MYEVLNRQMDFRSTSLVTLKKHTNNLAGKVTSLQEKKNLQHQYEGLHSSYIGLLGLDWAFNWIFTGCVFFMQTAFRAAQMLTFELSG